jgi:hypothetical protein
VARCVQRLQGLADSETIEDLAADAVPQVLRAHQRGQAGILLMQVLDRIAECHLTRGDLARARASRSWSA